MKSKLWAAVLQLAITMGTPAVVVPGSFYCAPESALGATNCAPDNSQTQFSTGLAEPTAKAVNMPATAVHPKVVFQINNAADAPTILRFITNYLIAEPDAEVAMVGYAGGVDFMLKGAKDSEGKPYADQLQALVDMGVHFKVCNNTLKSRNLPPEAVASQATVVPGAVNEIIRLQTREGYAYFRH